MNNDVDTDFQQRLQRLETLLGQVEGFPDARAKETTREVVQIVLDLHGRALERMMSLVAKRGEGAAEMMGALEADELVSTVMLLHGLHPQDTQRRVERALGSLKTKLAGGEVELDAIESGVTRVRFVGANGSLGSSEAKTIRAAIEEAIFGAAPEINEVTIDGLEPSNIVPVGRLTRKRTELAAEKAAP